MDTSPLKQLTTTQQSVGKQDHLEAVIVTCQPKPNKIVATTQSTQSPADFASVIKPFSPDTLANGFSTLIGALLGAMLAYLLQRKMQKSLELKAAITAGHQLMFAILQQTNTIILIQRDNIYSELNNPIRFISIPPTPAYDLNKNTLDPADLSFLLDDKKGRELLYDIYIAQECYVEALNQWNLRSTLHHEKVQTALSEAGIRSGSLMSLQELEVKLGIKTFGSIVNSTNNSIEALKIAFKKLTELNEKSRKYLVERFKTSDFIKFELPGTYGLED